MRGPHDPTRKRSDTDTVYSHPHKCTQFTPIMTETKKEKFVKHTNQGNKQLNRDWGLFYHDIKHIKKGKFVKHTMQGKKQLNQDWD